MMKPEPEAGIILSWRVRGSLVRFCTWMCTTEGATEPTTPVMVFEYASNKMESLKEILFIMKMEAQKVYQMEKTDRVAEINRANSS